MPTFERTNRFDRDYEKLSDAEKARFKKAVAAFVEDLARATGFRKSLRVRGVQGAGNVFEMTWAPDGRATFEYGTERKPGQPHIIWRRVGTHEVFDRP